jgi:enoyl-CoA hydratase/carnithine racemase
MVVERERRDGVGIIRLNRPEAKNAVSDEVSAGVEAALDEFEADDDIRAVIVTGTGDVFSAGADLKMVARGEGF